MATTANHATRQIAGGYTVVVESRPDAAVKAERIVLTQAQRKRLQVKRGFWDRLVSRLAKQSTDR